jgi:hypothetical protein
VREGTVNMPLMSESQRIVFQKFHVTTRAHTSMGRAIPFKQFLQLNLTRNKVFLKVDPFTQLIAGA